jgi:uncharacterized peroxidase-related enzyme
VPVASRRGCDQCADARRSILGALRASVKSTVSVARLSTPRSSVDADGRAIETSGHPHESAAVADISRFSVPDLAELPADIRARILEVQEKSGFVPNVFLVLARRPDEFRAFVAYHDALMERAGGLSKAEREMIVVATSALNRCQYCVVAHGAILRIRARNPLIADQVAINYLKADLSARERALLRFACKVATESYAVDEADFADMRAHGFDEEDIWDASAIAAFFALSNRLANVSGMRPNDEFYLMGRVPKSK